MSDMREKIMGTLSSIALPDGGDLASRDMVRALTVENGAVSFVIEAETPEKAAGMEAQRRAAEAAIAALDGVERGLQVRGIECLGPYQAAHQLECIGIESVALLLIL